MNQIVAVILAAGRGTRMGADSGTNKVVSTIEERPMISYAVEHLHQADIRDVVVVVGHAADSVREALGDAVGYATQTEALGTGDALRAALPILPRDSQLILSMYGDDSAFYPPKLFSQMIEEHSNKRAAITILTIFKQDPTGLGRILRNTVGDVVGIREEKNASVEERLIQEINTGLYCFQRSFVEEYIQRLEKNELSGEYYLTDLIAMAVADNKKVCTVTWEGDDVWCGVNTPEQLELAREKMSENLRKTSR